MEDIITTIVAWVTAILMALLSFGLCMMAWSTVTFSLNSIVEIVFSALFSLCMGGLTFTVMEG